MKVFYGIPKKRIIADILFSMVWSLFNATFSSMLGKSIGRFIDGDNIINTALSFIVFILIWEALEFIADVHSTYSGGIIEANVNKLYFNKLYGIKPSVLKENNTGYISGVLNKLVVRQESAYRHIVLNVPICLIYITYFSITIGKYHWLLGVTLILGAALGNIFRFAVGNRAEKYASDLTDAEGFRNKLIVDFVSNINTVQKMKSLKFMNKQIDCSNDVCLIRTKRYAVFEEIAYCGCKLFIFMVTPILIILSSYLDINGDVSEFYGLIAVIGIQLVHNSKSLVNAIANYNKFSATFTKLNDIIVQKNRRKELFTGKFECAKIFDLVHTYKYNKDGDTAGRTVTVNIPYFCVRKGDKVCLYGESGQGKTTLLHLLSGEIENNNTTINGEIVNKNLDCVFIAQDTEMFDMSLRDNLTLGKKVSDKKLISYLNRVGLGEWLECQEDGLNTMLGERGVFVSTGQRQRLNLVRGLLIEDKEVYLLDEPTSNVDESTEESMIQLIQEVLADKTVIVVTHRPKIMEICDVKYKFENGVLSLDE